MHSWKYLMKQIRLPTKPGNDDGNDNDTKLIIICNTETKKNIYLKKNQLQTCKIVKLDLNWSKYSFGFSD